jgi:hypothetical protein
MSVYGKLLLILLFVLFIMLGISIGLKERSRYFFATSSVLCGVIGIFTEVVVGGNYIRSRRAETKVNDQLVRACLVAIFLLLFTASLCLVAVGSNEFKLASMKYDYSVTAINVYAQPIPSKQLYQSTRTATLAQENGHSITVRSYDYNTYLDEASAKRHKFPTLSLGCRGFLAETTGFRMDNFSCDTLESSLTGYQRNENVAAIVAGVTGPLGIILGLILGIILRVTFHNQKSTPILAIVTPIEIFSE